MIKSSRTEFYSWGTRFMSGISDEGIHGCLAAFWNLQDLCLSEFNSKMAR